MVILVQVGDIGASLLLSLKIIIDGGSYREFCCSQNETGVRSKRASCGKQAAMLEDSEYLLKAGIPPRIEKRNKACALQYCMYVP